MKLLWFLLYIFATSFVDIECKSTVFSESGDDVNICCIADDWEGLLYLDMGIVFIDQNTAYSYINGTVHAAYSFTRKKVFFNVSGMELSPLIPKPAPEETVLLYDFEKVNFHKLLGHELMLYIVFKMTLHN